MPSAVGSLADATIAATPSSLPSHSVAAVGFIIAYFTEDDAMLLHVWAGYVVGALVVMRALRGLSGPSTPGSAISSILPSPDGSTWPPSSPSGASDTSVTPPAAVV